MKYWAFAVGFGLILAAAIVRSVTDEPSPLAVGLFISGMVSWVGMTRLGRP